MQSSRSVGGIAFEAQTDGVRCEDCGHQEVSRLVSERFNLLIAVDLARVGHGGPEAVRFQRHALGYSAAKLAELIGVTPDTISRWENNKHPTPRPVVILLATLAADRLHGNQDTETSLRAMNSPRPRGITRSLPAVTAFLPSK